MRGRNIGHRLRRKRSAGRGTSALVRAGDEARKTRVCGQNVRSIAMPELAPRIVEKGLASDAVVIDTVVAKYCDHLPLYRQQAILEREAGVEISRATLDGWVMRVGELLQPAVAAMRRICFAHPIYRPMKPRCPCRCTIKAEPIIRPTCGNTESPAARRCSSFNWAVGARVRKKFLGEWEGILQTDGYQAYDNIGGPKMVHVGCWAHARRKFVDAVKVNPQDARGHQHGHAHGRVVSGRPSGAAGPVERRTIAWPCAASTPIPGPPRFTTSA